MTVQNNTDTHLTKEIDSLRALLETEDNKHLKTFKMNALSAMIANPDDAKVKSDYQRAFEYVATRQYNKGALLIWLGSGVLFVTAILALIVSPGFLLSAPASTLLFTALFVGIMSSVAAFTIFGSAYLTDTSDNMDDYKRAAANKALPKAGFHHRFFTAVGLNSEKVLSDKILNSLTSETEPRSEGEVTQVSVSHSLTAEAPR